jgi:hypothetical protein
MAPVWKIASCQSVLTPDSDRTPVGMSASRVPAFA